MKARYSKLDLNSKRNLGIRKYCNMA